MMTGIQVEKLALLVALTLGACSSGLSAGRQVPSLESKPTQQLLKDLESTDQEEAHKAVIEIMRRGEVMLPALLELKGNKRGFYGYGLGHPNAAFLTPMPSGNRKRDDERVITVEVVALYLASGIYYGTLEFAQGALLTDETPTKMQRSNTRDRVAKAWSSLESWSKRWNAEGLDVLRKKNDGPLKSPGVRFWGTPD